MENIHPHIDIAHFCHRPTRNISPVISVLVVEDNDFHREVELEILDSPDFLVTEARNGYEALEILSENEFDVVLLDKRMPGMDGDELCVRIRHELNLKLLPIIMVTGSTSHGELEKSLSCGANDFIRKPYSSVELLARINAAANTKRITDQLDSAESMLFALARMVESKDEHTGDHCSRLEHMAAVFGEELGLDSKSITALRRGGVLHDIGKLAIPDSILTKSDRLSDNEWILMRQHTVIGHRLCENLKSMRLTIPIIRHHHERWDGKGYPDGLKGDEIPLLARVFQLLDIYDALANERPYKKAYPQEKSIEILQQESDKGLRDPDLTYQFIALIKDHPDSLELPSNHIEDEGERIFSDILATNVLNW